MIHIFEDQFPPFCLLRMPIGCTHVKELCIVCVCVCVCVLGEGRGGEYRLNFFLRANLTLFGQGVRRKVHAPISTFENFLDI